MGVIAHKVERVFPEAVTKDKTGFRSVAYSMLIAPIIESIKELNELVMELFKTSKENTREIASLKEENKALKNYICKQDPKAPFCKK